MIELYHWEPNAESLALIICLKEKDAGNLGLVVKAEEWGYGVQDGEYTPNCQNRRYPILGFHVR